MRHRPTRHVGEQVERLRFALLLSLAMTIPMTILLVLMLGVALPLPLLIVAVIVGFFALGWFLHPVFGHLGAGVARLLVAQGGDPAVPGYSEQEALVIAGREREAADSYRARLVAFPTDLGARIRLAELLVRLRELAEAERHFHEARHRASLTTDRLRITAGLADVHRASGRSQPLRDELARCAREFPGTAVGEHARRELRTLVTEAHARETGDPAPNSGGG